MAKILAVIRSSSERQETESQKLEMIQFCNEKGFSNEDIEIIEVAGASARKLNKKYIQMLEDIKSTLLNNNIKYAAFWHLNRLGRNESKLIEMKDFFKQNQIQVYIKYPSIQLLNDDGSLNEGANISWSVFSVMVEKDTEEMFAKMLRGRRRNSAMGKSNGGEQKFGFTVDENDMVIVDEEEAKIVKLIFNLYSTGKYSAKTLWIELKERGYNFNKWFVQRTLENTAYIGYTDYDDNRRSHRKYPRIISDELFNKCKEIRTKANTAIVKTKQVHFGIKLLKCSECGYNYIVNAGIYCCWKQKIEHTCTNKLSISQKNLDWLLWYVAKNWQIQYISKMNNEKKQEYIEQINVLLQKIEATTKKSEGIKGRLVKVAENYDEGIYDRKQRDARIAKIKQEDEVNQKQIISYKEEIKRLEDAINVTSSQHPLGNAINQMQDNASKLTLEQMNDIVHFQIKSINLEEDIYNGRRCFRIKIHSAHTTSAFPLQEFLYFPNNKQSKFAVIDRRTKEFKYYDDILIKYASEYWEVSQYQYKKSYRIKKGAN